jgi:pimeloyl-ACP methyl ester carboxylesterase
MTLLPPIGNGPPLVYLPGLDGTGEMLFPHEAELARSYRLLRIRSRDARPFEYEDLLDDVLHALELEGVDRATIMGESFGSTLALRLALTHPHRIEKLVLVSGFAYFPDRLLVRAGDVVGRLVPHAVLQGVRRSVIVPMLAVDGVAAEHRRRFVDIALGRPFDGYLGRVSLISRFDVRDRLGEIDIPTLVVAGNGDKLVPMGCSVELARLLPAATLRVLPGAGHACLLAPGVSIAQLLQQWAESGQACFATSGVGLEGPPRKPHVAKRVPSRSTPNPGA